MTHPACIIEDVQTIPVTVSDALRLHAVCWAFTDSATNRTPVTVEIEGIQERLAAGLDRRGYRFDADLGAWVCPIPNRVTPPKLATAGQS